MTQAIVNGFRVTGLHPFNADAVNYKKCKGHVNKPNKDAAELPSPALLNINNFQTWSEEKSSNSSKIRRKLQQKTQQWQHFVGCTAHWQTHRGRGHPPRQSRGTRNQ